MVFACVCVFLTCTFEKKGTKHFHGLTSAPKNRKTHTICILTKKEKKTITTTTKRREKKTRCVEIWWKKVWYFYNTSNVYKTPHNLLNNKHNKNNGTNKGPSCENWKRWWPPQCIAPHRIHPVLSDHLRKRWEGIKRPLSVCFFLKCELSGRMKCVNKQTNQRTAKVLIVGLSQKSSSLFCWFCFDKCHVFFKTKVNLPVDQRIFDFDYFDVQVIDFNYIIKMRA